MISEQCNKHLLVSITANQSRKGKQKDLECPSKPLFICLYLLQWLMCLFIQNSPVDIFFCTQHNILNGKLTMSAILKYLESPWR